MSLRSSGQMATARLTMVSSCSKCFVFVVVVCLFLLLWSTDYWRAAEFLAWYATNSTVNQTAVWNDRWGRDVMVSFGSSSLTVNLHKPQRWPHNHDITSASMGPSVRAKTSTGPRTLLSSNLRTAIQSTKVRYASLDPILRFHCSLFSQHQNVRVLGLQQKGRIW